MTIDPELSGYVEALARAWPEPPETLPLVEWRGRAERLAIAARPPWPDGIETEDLWLACQGRRVALRVYRPGAGDPTAVVVFIHGGGWTIGGIETHDAITASLAADTGCVVVSVDYALAPEHPFPAAFEDCRTALDWTCGNAGRFGASTEAVFVCGDSAGGNLAAALALQLRDEGRRSLAGQALIYPCLDPDMGGGSYVTEAEAPYLTARQMALFWTYYCPTADGRSNPLAAPMCAADLGGLPPAFIAVAEHDPIRDDGYAYAARLREAGVAVEFRPGAGLIHGYIRARSVCAAADREWRALCAWLRREAAVGV